MSSRPVAIDSNSVPLRLKPSIYPPLFAARMAGREKRQLGEVFGLSNFGVNLCRLLPGAVSALRHAHSRQDEFVYVLQGSATLLTNAGRTTLTPDMCAGFKAGGGDAHCLINETAEDVLYLEVGDRTPGDSAEYPDDDLKAVLIDGRWQFTDKSGVPYSSGSAP
ncbi:putative cupin superfamily protein [Panacagrimonas perspica]|uniref:Putative cupin superfamily protein n=1 Tax=Panacagrimonas perspica TaxID=381431 RepID=A0A4S3K4M9_9GAMM|nr:cupin domain-containing protein [Panacagrimonas perspica]TDU31861.1 putative cupin superfamily protein [Panacagrimonas perspica]THD02938.1 cupin [Panacagrimonas perspica]